MDLFFLLFIPPQSVRWHMVLCFDLMRGSARDFHTRHRDRLSAATLDQLPVVSLFSAIP